MNDKNTSGTNPNNRNLVLKTHIEIKKIAKMNITYLGNNPVFPLGDSSSTQVDISNTHLIPIDTDVSGMNSRP